MVLFNNKKTPVCSYLNAIYLKESGLTHGTI